MPTISLLPKKTPTTNNEGQKTQNMERKKKKYSNR